MVLYRSTVASAAFLALSTSCPPSAEAFTTTAATRSASRRAISSSSSLSVATGLELPTRSLGGGEQLSTSGGSGDGGDDADSTGAFGMDLTGIAFSVRKKKRERNGVAPVVTTMMRWRCATKSTTFKKKRTTLKNTNERRKLPSPPLPSVILRRDG